MRSVAATLVVSPSSDVIQTCPAAFSASTIASFLLKNIRLADNATDERTSMKPLVASVLHVIFPDVLAATEFCLLLQSDSVSLSCVTKTVGAPSRHCGSRTQSPPSSASV